MVKETKTRADSAVVFLDVDGVLNCNSTRFGAGVREIALRTAGGARIATGAVEIDKVQMLAEALERCGARIVVSSSWRKGFESAAQFAGAIGIAPPLASARDLFHRDWHTEWKFSSSRDQEIGLWLADHRSVKRFAILDDHDVCARRPELEPHFVRTDSDVGLTEADIARVESILRLATS